MEAAIFFEGSGVWHVLTSPSMRSLGEVLKQPDGSLRIEPDEHSDMATIGTGPYTDLDEVMTAIAAHIGGRCTIQRKAGSRRSR